MNGAGRGIDTDDIRRRRPEKPKIRKIGRNK